MFTKFPAPPAPSFARHFGIQYAMILIFHTKLYSTTNQGGLRVRDCICKNSWLCCFAQNSSLSWFQKQEENSWIMRSHCNPEPTLQIKIKFPANVWAQFYWKWAQIKAGAFLERLHLSEFVEKALKARSVGLRNLGYICVPKIIARSLSFDYFAGKPKMRPLEWLDKKSH